MYAVRREEKKPIFSIRLIILSCMQKQLRTHIEVQQCIIDYEIRKKLRFFREIPSPMGKLTQKKSVFP